MFFTWMSLVCWLFSEIQSIPHNFQLNASITSDNAPNDTKETLPEEQAFFLKDNFNEISMLEDNSTEAGSGEFNKFTAKDSSSYSKEVHYSLQDVISVDAITDGHKISNFDPGFDPSSILENSSPDPNIWDTSEDHLEEITTINQTTTQNDERNQEQDLCNLWILCQVENLRDYLEQLISLPSCPCTYPTEIFYNNKIWDENLGKHISWIDASGKQDQIHVYKPGAAYCIRSFKGGGITGLEAQQCCYDPSRNLITRGSGAGTPNLISPEISKDLHYEIDLRPWVQCKGNWVKYNQVRVPNNGNNCTTNPNDQQLAKQIATAEWY